ncbi:MAG TPA: MEDS domain-containing protein [Myxococcota bacterium]|nr:MEDS domain-containing protein [Myxococcota bacterium]
MLGGSPDEARFERVIGELIERARAGGRRVRAIGELVALLWARGNQSAAVHLEYLWNRMLKARRFPLFCAYPRMSFTDDLALSVDAVCRAHTRVFAS